MNTVSDPIITDHQFKHSPIEPHNYCVQPLGYGPDSILCGRLASRHQVELLVDDNRCINCHEPVDPKQPHKVLAIYSRAEGGLDGGSLELLEEWPLCHSCEGSQPARLVDYVKFKLT